MPAGRCVEHLELYRLLLKSQEEKNMGKKCFAVEAAWMQQFELYGRELAQRNNELLELTVG